ncbi:hypothetical protein FACS1894188_02170 [Clostridia bacterium]|nr:hypothetical protein FACS1894188_02170 [Clostridia bacterium]
MPQNEYNIPPKGLILKFENSTFARHEALSAALAFAELAGVSVIPVDVSTDLGGEIANQYGVKTLPTLKFFRDGEFRATHTGAISKEALLKILDAL